LINVMILAPRVKAHLGIHIKTGSKKHTVPLHSGQANTFTVPFVPGPVSFEITADRQGVREVVLGGQGREIMDQAEKYNFNMWTGSWRAKFEDPK
jgi:glucan endo-1,3-alpha-glucosidase